MTQAFVKFKAVQGLSAKIISAPFSSATSKESVIRLNKSQIVLHSLTLFLMIQSHSSLDIKLVHSLI